MQMKLQSLSLSLKKWTVNTLLVLVMLAVNTVAFGQLSGPSNPDVEPENPPAVPLDDHLHIILLAAGAILIFFKFRSIYRKQQAVK